MKNIIVTMSCFAVLGILFGGCLWATLAKLDESNSRVAALEQQNNELQDELHSNTDALIEEIASVTDANLILEEKLEDVNDKYEDLKEEQEKEKEEEEKNKAVNTEIKQQTQKASYSPAPTPQPEPTAEVAEETTVGSGDGYLGSYELTAYTWTGNPCASGVYPEDGITVASNTIPLGTKIYIEGIGERTVQDTGGMSGGVIDVYMDNYNDCIQFGRQSAEVYILE